MNPAAGAALGATFPPYISPAGAGPADPNADPVVGADQLGCAFLLAHEESQLTVAVVVAVGKLNALSSSARAEYLSAETGGGAPLTVTGPPILLAPADADVGPGPGIRSLANASKFAKPDAVSATYNGLSIIIMIICIIIESSDFKYNTLLIF